MRARFAASLVEYVKSHSFDGLDVDIEGPSITDDYSPFIEELAKAFKPQNKLLTSELSKYPDAETSDKVGNTIWHNAIPTIKQKTRYAMDQELGGIMIWSLDNDVAGSRSLFKAIIDTYQSR